MYAQHGHGPGQGTSDKIRLGAQGGLLSGAILSCRHLVPSVALEYRAELEGEGLTVLLDPQVYLLAPPVDSLLKLDQWDHVPSNMPSSGAARIRAACRDATARAVDWQLENGFETVVISGPPVSSFASAETGSLLYAAELAAELADDSGTRFLNTLCISEMALRSADRPAMHEWLDEAVTCPADGFYLLIDRAPGATAMLADPEMIDGLMYLVFVLSGLHGKEVLLGYSGLWSVLGMAAGATGVATGWGMSLRRLSVEALRDTGPRSAAKRRLWSREWLSEPKEDEIESLRLRAAGALAGGQTTEAAVLGGDLTVLASPTSEVLHNWRVLRRIASELFDSTQPCGDRVASLEAATLSAASQVAHLNGGTLPPWATHLLPWADALQAFSGANSNIL